MTPVEDDAADGSDNSVRLVVFNPQERSNLPCQIEVQGVIVFVDAEGQAGSVFVGVEVESGREGPSLGGKQESMVAEVVVAVGDGDIENDPPEEFDQVSVHIGAVPGNPVRQFEVADT